jgi:hypothetical protein
MLQILVFKQWITNCIFYIMFCRYGAVGSCIAGCCRVRPFGDSSMRGLTGSTGRTTLGTIRARTPGHYMPLDHRWIPK